MEQTLKVALPVSVNARLIRAHKRQTMIWTPRYRQWFATAVAQIREQRQHETMIGRVSVEVEIHYPDNRKRDIDNSLKGLFDACTHAGVWCDDSQIDCINVIRSSVAKPGYVSVRIKEIS